MSVLRELVADAKAVGRAYLAEHHADDGEIVESPQVDRWGWLRVGSTWYAPGCDDPAVYWVSVDRSLRVGPRVVCKDATRGHVRRLLAALGVPAEARP